MSQQPDFSAIDQITRGDARQARELRADLALIARRTDDPTLRALTVSVLRGEQSVRRVFEHPTFWDMAGRSLANLEEGLDQLSEEDREFVMGHIGPDGTPEDELADLAESTPPPPEEPPRRRHDDPR